MRAREDLLAIVSHDLRNPLSTIEMAAALVGEKVVDEDVGRHLQLIHRASRRMSHLIGDLLDTAGIQAGRLSIAKRPEDPGALVREAWEAHETAARAKGIAIAYAAPPAGPAVSCDRDRLLQRVLFLMTDVLSPDRAFILLPDPASPPEPPGASNPVGGIGPTRPGAPPPDAWRALITPNERRSR